MALLVCVSRSPHVFTDTTMQKSSASSRPNSSLVRSIACSSPVKPAPVCRVTSGNAAHNRSYGITSKNGAQVGGREVLLRYQQVYARRAGWEGLRGNAGRASGAGHPRGGPPTNSTTKSAQFRAQPLHHTSYIDRYRKEILSKLSRSLQHQGTVTGAGSKPGSAYLTRTPAVSATSTRTRSQQQRLDELRADLRRESTKELEKPVSRQSVVDYPEQSAQQTDSDNRPSGTATPPPPLHGGEASRAATAASGRVSQQNGPAEAWSNSRKSTVDATEKAHLDTSAQNDSIQTENVSTSEADNEVSRVLQTVTSDGESDLDEETAAMRQLRRLDATPWSQLGDSQAAISLETSSRRSRKPTTRRVSRSTRRQMNLFSRLSVEAQAAINETRLEMNQKDDDETDSQEEKNTSGRGAGEPGTLSPIAQEKTQLVLGISRTSPARSVAPWQSFKEFCSHAGVTVDSNKDENDNSVLSQRELPEFSQADCPLAPKQDILTNGVKTERRTSSGNGSGSVVNGYKDTVSVTHLNLAALQSNGTKGPKGGGNEDLATARGSEEGPGKTPPPRPRTRLPDINSPRVSLSTPPPQTSPLPQLHTSLIPGIGNFRNLPLPTHSFRKEISFQITPLGYDCRYEVPNMEGFDETPEHVKNRAVEKCSDWINKYL